MKTTGKLLMLTLAAFALASCDDDCDHGFDRGASVKDILVGSWYEETMNEEDVYSPSGTFYGKYCNTMTQGDGRGTYFIDSENNRLTWSYSVNGMSMMSDWHLSDATKYQFTMSSDVATLTYGKIVETYNMEGGQMQQIAFSEQTVLGYESTNANIAAVSADGLITTTGEKGTAYIKIKLSDANVWAKVMVGDETNDLWIDYSQLIGQDYSAMKQLLGTPDQTADFGTYTSYSYMTTVHNIINYLNVSIDATTHLVDQIDLHLKEGVPQDEVMAYMNARYFRLSGNYGTQYHYSTSQELELSRATFSYETNGNAVLIFSAEAYMKAMGLLLWPNLTNTLGMTKEEVKEEMDKRGYEFLQSMDNYSSDGSDGYLVSGFDEVWAAEFVFNPDHVVSQVWIYLYQYRQKYYNYLNEHYTYARDEFVRGSGVYPFYNADRSIKIELNQGKAAVVFTSTTLKPFVPVETNTLMADYAQFVGKTRLKMAEMMDGQEPSQQFKNFCDYNFSDDTTVKRVGFYFADATYSGGIEGVIIDLQSGADASTVASYLGSVYKEQTSSATVKKYLSSDGKVSISFETDKAKIYFLPEGNPSEPVADAYPQLWIDYTKYFGLNPDEIKAVMGEPLLDYGTVLAYPVVNDLIASVYLYFNDSNKMYAMYVDGSESADGQQIIDALNKRYYSEGTQENNGITYYLWRDSEDASNAKIRLNYNPNRKRIAYQVL